MKRNLPSICVILYKSKVLANGEYPLMLRVSYNGQRKYKSVGLSCSEKNWNKNKQEVRQSHPMAKNMNTIIRNEIDKANRYVMSVEGQQQSYSANSIIKAISKSAPTTHTLFSLIEERISFFRDTTQKHNTASGYRTLLNIIKRFNYNEDIELFDLTKAWVNDFELYLHSKYADNSVRKFFDCLKAVMNYAIAKDYVKESPLTNYKFIKDLNCTTRKRALTIAEITTLMQYYHDTYGFWGTNTRPNLEKTRVHYWNQKFKPRGTTKLTPIDAEQFSLALFICSYMFQGLALVDMANLKRKDLRRIKVADQKKWLEDAAMHGIEYANANKREQTCYEIIIKRQKTNHPTRIVCNANFLIPYLNPFGSCVNGNEDDEELEEYVFPIYDKDNDDEYIKYERMKYAIYLVNVNLKRVAQRVGIDHGLTFYSARHSYASNLYHSNVPVGLIAQNMGRNPADIETYLKAFDTENILDANRKALIIGQDAFNEVWEQNKKDIRPKRRRQAGTSNKDDIEKEGRETGSGSDV